LEDDRYPMRGRLRVTTPILPVNSSEPNRPPPRLRSSLLSSCSLQHMERTSPGLRFELMKFWKYGVPYLPVILNKRCAFSLSQLKFLVRLMVGMGYEKPRPSASPSISTSRNALLTMSISFWNSP